MRTARALSFAACVAFCVAAGARPAESERVDLHVRRDPMQLVLRDALVGGLAGAAVGGGVLGVMSATGQHRDWAAVLATSAGIGLAVGLVWGMVQAGTPPPPAMALRPGTDGWSFGDQHRSDLSGRVMLPVFGHRF